MIAWARALLRRPLAAAASCPRLPARAAQPALRACPTCRLGEELGRGAFGQVYLGLDTRTGEHVAIKQLSLERIPTENLQARAAAPACPAAEEFVWCGLHEVAA